MAPWERIKPNRARELEQLRAAQSAEAHRDAKGASKQRELWLARIVQVLRDGEWAPIAAANEWERNWYAAELGSVLALGTDADVADYLRVMEADPPERPARPIEAYGPLVASLRAINALRDAE